MNILQISTVEGYGILLAPPGLFNLSDFLKKISWEIALIFINNRNLKKEFFPFTRKLWSFYRVLIKLYCKIEWFTLHNFFCSENLSIWSLLFDISMKTSCQNSDFLHTMCARVRGLKRPGSNTLTIWKTHFQKIRTHRQTHTGITASCI